MPRTKGAKGRKTLAKERAPQMGMTVEEYLEKEKQFPGFYEAWLSSQVVKDEQRQIKKKENFKEIKGQINLDLNPSSKDGKSIGDSESLNLEKKSKEITLDKNKLNLNPEETKFKEITLDKSKELSKKKTTKKSEPIICERCKSEIKSLVPFRVNLTYLTTMPNYHRKIKEDRPLLCDNCIKELNKLVEEFLWNDGKGLDLKFGQTEL